VTTMLIVVGTFRIEPAQRDAFVASRKPGMEVSRAERGCLQYVFAPDPIEPDVVHLFERWESKEALAAHLERARSQPAASGDAPQPLSMSLVQYEIASEGPVGS
jgi:quinol monooxygenase YgiN